MICNTVQKAASESTVNDTVVIGQREHNNIPYANAKSPLDFNHCRFFLDGADSQYCHFRQIDDWCPGQTVILSDIGDGKCTSFDFSRKQFVLPCSLCQITYLNSETTQIFFISLPDDRYNQVTIG
jgi:hypothetical protein